MGFVAYYCDTPQDECVNDSDCIYAGVYCLYDPVVQLRWVCTQP